MADLDLTRLEELAEKATRAPWAVDEMPGFEHHVRTGGTASAIPSTGEPVADTALDADAEFIAAMRNAVPSLLAAARAVQRVEAALDLLASDTPGEMLVLPPEHHACEREITRLAVVALRAALDGAE